MKKIINKLINENPVFVLMLGLCSSLAVTTTLEQSYMMGIAVIFVLFFSNVVVSLIKKIIPESVKIPVYILIIGTFVTVISLLLEKYVPNLYNAFGIYLSLITVNCIVLGRAISFASKSSVSKSMLDALVIGCGYMFALICIGFIRELLGNNSLTIIDNLSSLLGFKLVFQNILPEGIFPISVFISPAGAFITIGILVALINNLRRKYESN